MTTTIILSLIGLCLGQWHAIIKLQGGITRKQIEEHLKELEWVDFEDGNLLAQTGLPLDAYIQRYNNKYLASGKRTTYLENDIARITLTAEEAKKELRAWQVEQVYRLFKHD